MPTITREFRAAATPYLTGEKPAYATTLVAILTRLYGVDVFEWDPVTIQLEIKDDFGVEMPRKVYDRMQALLTALTTDSVYKRVDVFDEIVSALSGHSIGVEKDIPAVDDVAWAVVELRLNDPEPVSRDPKEPFNRDIGKYVRVVLDNEGLDIAPRALSFAPGRTVKAEGMADNQYYAGAWGSAQASADEIDQLMDQRVMELIDQLYDIGVVISEGTAKTADWTSPENRLVHVEKHAPEFGGEEEYDEAERLYGAAAPATTEQFCEVDAQGNVRCKERRGFDDGVVHVRTDDGRTITLFAKGDAHKHMAELARKRRATE